MKIITGQDARCGPWLAAKQGIEWYPGSGSTIGLEDENGELLAVTCFDTYNGVNIGVHIAAVPGKRWMTREYLWYIFHYPFKQLKVRRVTAVIASTNADAWGFIENLGFTLEATLKDAHPGGDLKIYRMYSDECRWLNLKERRNGKAEGSSTT